jgi:hypothetical protein
MDRSVFLARLMGPTFIAIALGMLINLGMYETMIAEALSVLPIRPAVTARGPRDRQYAQYVVCGLARYRHGSWLADDDRRHHTHCRAAGRDCDRFDYL